MLGVPFVLRGLRFRELGFRGLVFSCSIRSCGYIGSCTDFTGCYRDDILGP